jgi:hypothetical protein
MHENSPPHQQRSGQSTVDVSWSCEDMGECPGLVFLIIGYFTPIARLESLSSFVRLSTDC